LFHSLQAISCLPVNPWFSNYAGTGINSEARVQIFLEGASWTGRLDFLA
jgi:hypothetical protein